ncbi:LLM class flavin-dependent oxidoreductase [Virgisporangium aurantiacum]|uniref:Putative monooxygenase (Luciferase-like) n=1 Tax=Virgisporangium aurantiacum TaxID=175570 RepID=A0A8J3Z6Z7_9ACTN|nr:LLM class flavin-dependent oxidoreductase [Virgisporangium aurantiacum]GIJ58576.1 putative monooxygenase (luciferase-like) [Virgisporangium aurantiacum]
MTTPLSILDLAPVKSVAGLSPKEATGNTAAKAIRETIDLAVRAEAAGYHRYWLAEHHFTPGVASSSPAVLIALVAAATQRIRVGSGAVQLGHQTAIAVVEQFGTIDALHPGRIDLGLGRSGQRRAEAVKELNTAAPPKEEAFRTDNGLLIPAPFSFSKLLASPKFALYASLLQQPGAESPDFADQVDDIIALLAGTYVSADGLDAHAVPGEGADLDLWILGSSGGQSAQVAGERGLPFAANYHVAPSAVLEAVEAYRAAFKPSARLDKPHVLVSADVVVAATDSTAAELAAPYGLWVRSIRTGHGAIPFPSAVEAAAHEWTDDDRQLVADRVDTQFVGTPDRVADQLRVLRDATDADELLVTTITHDHTDRVRSFDLLAEEWVTS